MLAEDPDEVDATKIPNATGLPMYVKIVAETQTTMTSVEYVVIKRPPYDFEEVRLRKIRTGHI